MTAWTAGSEGAENVDNVYEALLPTGIDISHKKIRVTADQFEIYNNSGEQTFGVDSSGTAYMENILLGGLQWKQIAKITDLTTLQSFFTVTTGAWQGAAHIGSKVCTPAVKQLKGIYLFSGTPNTTMGAKDGYVELNFPEMYFSKAIDSSDTESSWDGDAQDSDAAMMLRCLTGNTIVVCNNATDETIISIGCWSCYWTDQYVKLSSASATAAKASQSTVDGGTTVDNPFSSGQVPYNTSDTSSIGMWVGRARDEIEIQLHKGQTATLQCVCEMVGGYECVRWIGGAGTGWGYFNT